MNVLERFECLFCGCAHDCDACKYKKDYPQIEILTGKKEELDNQVTSLKDENTRLANENTELTGQLDILRPDLILAQAEIKKLKKELEACGITADQSLDEQFETLLGKASTSPATYLRWQMKLDQRFKVPNVEIIDVTPELWAEYEAWFRTHVAPAIRRNNGTWSQMEDRAYTTFAHKADVEEIIKRSSWVPLSLYIIDQNDCDDKAREQVVQFCRYWLYDVNFGALVRGQCLYPNENKIKAHKFISIYCGDGPVTIDVTRTATVHDAGDPDMDEVLQIGNWNKYEV